MILENGRAVESSDGPSFHQHGRHLLNCSIDDRIRGLSIFLLLLYTYTEKKAKFVTHVLVKNFNHKLKTTEAKEIKTKYKFLLFSLRKAATLVDQFG